MAKQKIKGSRKNFYEVSAPLTAVNIQLYGSSVDELDGKVVRLDLTKSLRGKSLELKIKVRKEGDKLKAEPISVQLVGSYVRRSMRRGSDYVEDSFEVVCRDFIARIKPFLITRNRVSRAIRKALRDSTKKYIEAHLKIRTIKEIFSDIMSNKLQKGLSLKLKKVYPLAMCEIRVFEILREKPKGKERKIGKEEEREGEEEKVEGKESVRKRKNLQPEEVEEEEKIIEENEGEEESEEESDKEVVSIARAV